jgi:nitrogen regulatory protein P-II 1
MEIKLIVAYMPRDRLEKVEQALRRIGVERIDVMKVRGYGEYREISSADWMTDEVKVEVVTRQHKVDAIVRAMLDAVHVALPGAGVIAVLPVDNLYLIRTGAEATPEEFWPKQSPQAGNRTDT